MGNSQKKPALVKLDTAIKTGALNYSDMNLKSTSSIWPRLLEESVSSKLKTIDISGNTLKALPVEIYSLVNLKLILAARCNMQRTEDMTALTKLGQLDLSSNDFEGNELKALPSSLVKLNLANNHFSHLPISLSTLHLLVEFNISGNRLENITGIGALVSLTVLNLDDNMLIEIPEEVSLLVNLLHLSLRNNRISRQSPTTGSQSIPEVVFRSTMLERLELAGNTSLLSKDVLAWEGVTCLMERRRKTKDKSFQGGAMTDMSLFGLD